MRDLLTIIITTKNRINELKKTLHTLSSKNYSGVKILICDDGSNDGTFKFLKEHYPNIRLIRNQKNKGLIYSRNRLMNLIDTQYAISLDDDANFLIEPDFESIVQYFQKNEKCAILTFRLYWGISLPHEFNTEQKAHRVKSYAGCAHVLRTSAWHQIPDYPEWFKFYGEEDFAALHLFKKGLEVHYYPDILVHHRVIIKSRKKNKDYIQRTRRSLRSGWYLYLMFYPIKEIPKRMIYSIWMQIKLKLFKGDLRAFLGLIMAICDLIFNLPRVLKNSDRLTSHEFHKYMQLEDAKLYWSP